MIEMGRISCITMPSKIKKELIITMMALFFWGAHLVYIAFPFSFALIILSFFKNKYYNARSIYMALAFNIFVVIVFGFGADNFVPGLSWKTIFIISFFSFFVIFLQSSDVRNDVILSSYALGVLCKVMIVVGYSIYLNPITYGYGLLYDPYLDQEVNSPIFANLLCLIIPIFIYNCKTQGKYFWYGLLLIIAAGFFLNSRTFFLCLITSAILFLFFDNEKKIKYFIFLFLFVCIFFVVSIIFDDSYIYEKISHLFVRFNEIGFRTSRFDLWESAIDKLINSPLGWYGVDQSVEKTNWYHNLWLDVARVSGVFGLCSLIIINVLFLVFSVRFDLYLIISLIVTFLVCMQDVIIEANIQPLLFYYLTSLLMLKSK
ncbi:O-antigen ligase family protein [Aeromonas caviae]|uniref:O-antigen ligase family protein n=1 Tax=Aeromonas caviae TaxID=648 RepID=UPI003F74A179